ncbi:hypothetical protein [Gordonia sp. NPDC003422]
METNNHPNGPEVCFNLWAFADENTGVILRISGKAYVLDGSDEEKTALLRTLSASDFMSAPHRGVPTRYSIVTPANRTIEGAVMPNQLNDVAGIFGSLLDELSVLPTQLRTVNGHYEEFWQPGVSAPLYVLTVVVECNDGRLMPRQRIGAR